MMTLPYIWLFKAPITAAYRQDTAVLQDALATLSKVPGVLGQWHGPGMLEDVKLGYLIVAWDTAEHAQAFADSPLRADFDTALQRAFDAAHAVYSHHLTFNIAPQRALDAHVTEFALWRPKAGTDVATFEGAIARLHAFLAAHVAPTEAAGAVGRTHEDPGLYVACLGWDSIKSFSNMVDRAMIEETAVVEGLLRTADSEARLVQLSRYSPGS